MFNKIFGRYIPPNTRIAGKDIKIRCPFHGGGGERTPSLSIHLDPNKQVWHCLACGEGGTWIEFFQKVNNLTYPQALEALELQDNNSIQYIPAKKEEKILTDYTKDIFNACETMQGKFYETYAKKLYNLRGLTYSTAVACQIGLKKEGWVLPVIKFDSGEYCGYEIREKNFQLFSGGNKCYKAKNTPSCLSYVWDGWEDGGRCFITEGFMDGYFLYQYLSEKEGQEFPIKDTILTPSCGVTHLPELVQENLDKLLTFKEITFILDNDEAGNKAKALISAISDKFKFFKGLKDGEDWEEFYKRSRK